MTIIEEISSELDNLKTMAEGHLLSAEHLIPLIESNAAQIAALATRFEALEAAVNAPKIVETTTEDVAKGATSLETYAEKFEASEEVPAAPVTTEAPYTPTTEEVPN